MNRPWGGKDEGVDMGVALGKAFPHQMVYRVKGRPGQVEPDIA